MQVKHIMQQPVVTVGEETSLADAAETRLFNHIGGVPVVNAEGRLVGIITESDFTAKEKGIPFSTFRAPQVLGEWLGEQRHEDIYRAARKRQAREIMNRQVVTVSENDEIETVVNLMLRHDINRVPVVRDGVPVGIVARHDLLLLIWTNDLEEEDQSFRSA